MLIPHEKRGWRRFHHDNFVNAPQNGDIIRHLNFESRIKSQRIAAHQRRQVEIGQRYTLDQCVEAHRDLEAGRTIGSSVFVL